MLYLEATYFATAGTPRHSPVETELPFFCPLLPAPTAHAKKQTLKM